VPAPLIAAAGVIAAGPFAAALAAGLRTGRISVAAWAGINADRGAQPVLFWLLVFFNAAMAVALICAAATIVDGSA
jgi:hypothetical protein